MPIVISLIFHIFVVSRNASSNNIINRHMKWIKWLVAAIAASLMVLACEQPEPDTNVEVEPKLTVSPVKPAQVSAAGGEFKLSLTANKDWSVTGIPAWMTVSPESGKGSLYKQEILVSVQQNTAGAREAVLTFAIDGKSQTVPVVQNHAFGANAPANAIFFESFEKNQGNFTIENVTMPDPLTYVWIHDANYTCMKASAFKDNTRYQTESWLISPEIDLTGYTNCYLTFEHAGLYFGNIAEEATAWVSVDGGDWKQLVIEEEGYPSSWTFISAGEWDFTPYIGSKVKLGFKYTSNSSKAGTWEIKNVAVISGKSSKVTVADIDPTKTEWMEMPATDNDAYGYYAHRFVMDNEIYRNYSFAWSQKDLVSVWIAYPLNKTYTQKNVDRTDAWAYDPHLGKDLSAAPFSYYAGDYARGHQLPSADRLCSKEANKQTFYGTNIAPQLNEHNEGIWSNLETRVREIANSSDTTYVVTGCVVDGATETSTDSDGKTITIPVAFFKALLRYQKGAETEWAGAAFYTEHKNYTNKDLKAISMSIDQLEELTGIDFFVNLPAKVGKDAASAIESTDPTTLSILGLK